MQIFGAGTDLSAQCEWIRTYHCRAHFSPIS